jgi:hypothetical protein
MAVKRFLLDTSELNDATYGLDGFSPAFTLDTSTLDGNGLLDGADFLITATGTASFGAMSATATATVTHSVTASASLGGLSSTATATVILPATASANLGGLVSSATATVVLPATASADLGGLASSATATVALSATASASLGGLVASAINAVEQEAVATANLGGLTATVNSIPTPPEPTPEPTPVGGRQYAAPKRLKKIEPEPVVEPVIIEPKRRYAVGLTSLSGMNARAEATITFSILEDDAEVLLMI